MNGKSHILVHDPKQTKEQSKIGQLKDENKEFVNNISKLKREFEVFKDKLFDYDEIQKESDLYVERLKSYLRWELLIKILILSIRIRTNDNLFQRKQLKEIFTFAIFHYSLKSNYMLV